MCQHGRDQQIGYAQMMAILNDPTDAMIQRGVDALRSEPSARDEAKVGVIWNWMLMESGIADEIAAFRLEFDPVQMMADRQQFDEPLAVFINHWGLDSYEPPEDVIDCVRHIVAVVRSAAIRARDRKPLVLRAQRSPSAVSEDVEAILGKPKSVEEMLPRTMATLAAMREESSIAPAALSEGGE